MKTNASAVRHSLSLILESPYFVTGPKPAAFLKYVVTKTLEGEGDRLKAYSIAVDALNKPVTFDPKNDPCVRVMASRMRAALREYNAKPNVASITINLEIGSYQPVFTAKEPVEMHQESET